MVRCPFRHDHWLFGDVDFWLTVYSSYMHSNHKATACRAKFCWLNWICLELNYIFIQDFCRVVCSAQPTASSCSLVSAERTGGGTVDVFSNIQTGKTACHALRNTASHAPRNTASLAIRNIRTSHSLLPPIFSLTGNKFFFFLNWHSNMVWCSGWNWDSLSAQTICLENSNH